MGYKTTIIYTFVDDPNICINRIKIRVKEGGHNIPDEDVIRRYHRSRNNFWNKYKEIADSWIVFYNGIEKTELVASGEKSDYNVLDEATFNLLIEGISND